MFYIPLIPYYIYSAIKARNLIFYLVANPAIKYSGNGTESKFETLQLIPNKYKPKTVLINNSETFKKVLLKLTQNKISFPLIAKPDIGFRGYLVKKIDSEDELKSYLTKNDIAVIIQEYINYPKECGIFYSRIPGQAGGKITSITLKKFLTIKGDGQQTLSELILSDNRAYLYYNLLQGIHKENINRIPKRDELVSLTVIGNHSKGTQFLNGNYLITDDLVSMFDSLTNQMKNWYYGRLDIKYHSFDELINGKNIKILEVNGIISEPTHIYDPQNATYIDALISIKSHWQDIAQIAKVNHENFNVPYPKFFPYIKEMIWLRKYSKKIIKLNKSG
jgi:hypothetical protein